jgi:flagellar protein FlaJ
MSLGLSTEEFDFSSLLSTANHDIPTIEFLLVLVILFNALLSSLMIRTVDGGHKVNAYLHFVILAWLGAIIAVVTKIVVATVISI